MENIYKNRCRIIPQQITKVHIRKRSIHNGPYFIQNNVLIVSFKVVKKTILVILWIEVLKHNIFKAAGNNTVRELILQAVSLVLIEMAKSHSNLVIFFT